jgi:threonine dehydrogenase-like Zn-dependent dehydrogenase
MAEFLVANETQLYKVGAEADLTAIALAEPTSCAAHGVLKAEIKPGDHVVICGAGPIGVLAMQVARLFSPQTLILVEVDPLKLAAATQWGATHAVDAKAGDVAERIREITQGRGADAVIECSGNLAALQASFQYAGTKGRIAAIGVPSQMRIETDFLAMLINDLTFRASNGYTTAVWTWVLKLLAGGKIDHQRIITHKLPLEQVDRGLKLLQDRTEMVVKVMLHASN